MAGVTLKLNGADVTCQISDGRVNPVQTTATGPATVIDVTFTHALPSEDSMEKKLEKYIREHPPGPEQDERKYYKKVRTSFGPSVAMIKKELIKQGFKPHKVQSEEIWRKRA